MTQKKKEISKQKVKYIVMTILTIFVAIAIPFVVKVVSNIIVQNQNTEETDPPDEPSTEPAITPTLTVPENIEIDKFTTDFEFEYEVTNLGEYQISILQ